MRTFIALLLMTTVAAAQTSVGEVVGQVCVGSYEVAGFKGLTLIRFRPAADVGTLVIERYRITDQNFTKLQQTNGGTYDVGFPNRLRLPDWEQLQAYSGTFDASKANGVDYPIEAQSAPNEWRARLVDNKLTTYSVQWDRSDRRLSGIVGIKRTSNFTCGREK